MNLSQVLSFTEDLGGKISLKENMPILKSCLLKSFHCKFSFFIVPSLCIQSLQLNYCFGLGRLVLDQFE